MNILNTAEVRWFWEGNLPGEISPALNEIPSPLLQESRTDRYLIFPGNSNIGIKLRQGSFEIKSLLKSGDLSVGNEGLRATCEYWQKISLRNFSWDPSSDEFVEVYKSRLTRLYLWENDQWKSTDTLSMSDNGCQIELSQIKIRNTPYWSFGLEASGTKENLCYLVRSIWTKLSAESNLVGLLKDHSGQLGALSYPALFREVLPADGNSPDFDSKQ